MRRRLGIYGTSGEALRLIGLLVGNPEIDVVRVYDPEPEAALDRARGFGPELVDFLRLVLTDDLEAFVLQDDLHGVIDAGPAGELHRRIPAAADRGLQIVTPLAARLLWAYGVAARERKTELLQALHEVVESVQLTVDSDELFTRMLEIAIGVTGADGGSLMLLDAGTSELRIRVAVGVERELWPKIRVPLGEGIAGRAAADGRSLRIAGKADHERFRIVRERIDIESALCVPLVDRSGVLGVLNLHHTTQHGHFSEEDLAFVEELAFLDAQIIARAQQHEELRDHAARYEAVRDLHEVLGRPDPLSDRLRELCRVIAQRAGDGIVHLYLREGDDDELRLAATSLEGGSFGSEYRIVSGQGIDGGVAETREARFLRDERGQLAYASLPLTSGGALIGVLSIQASNDAPGDRRTQEAMRELAGALADELAQAAREGRMATRATRLSAIHEAGMRMLAARSVAEVVRLATSSAVMILDAEHAVLRLRDETTRRFVLRSYFGPADGPDQERLYRLDQHTSLRALQARRAMRIRDVEDEDELRQTGTGCLSLLSAPLLRDGNPIGTLSVYDKIPGDGFGTGHFDEDDLPVFAQLCTYVERAVAAARERALAHQHRHIDVETGLPNASFLYQRVREELARAEGREGQLAVASCCIENFAQIAQEAGGAHATQVAQRVGETVRQVLRDFDVVGRTAPARFEILFPSPGSAPGDRVYKLARAVADAISKDETLNRPVRVALGFGYAIHPEDGTQLESLIEAARPPRIRMV